MQGKYRIAPAPKEANIAKLIVDELERQGDYRPRIAIRGTSWYDATTGLELTKKGLREPKQEQCCVVQ